MKATLTLYPKYNPDPEQNAAPSSNNQPYYTAEMQTTDEDEWRAVLVHNLPDDLEITPGTRIFIDVETD